MSWRTNTIMEWWDTRIYTGHAAASWMKISDHNRAPLNIAVERIETKQRMVDGTLRRYFIASKRTFTTSWDMFPSKAGTLLINGQDGDWMEKFHYETNGSFLMRLRRGVDEPKLTTDPSIQEFKVMISDFSNEIAKRGPKTDLWTMDITLEEC